MSMKIAFQNILNTVYATVGDICRYPVIMVKILALKREVFTKKLNFTGTFDRYAHNPHNRTIESNQNNVAIFVNNTEIWGYTFFG